MENAVILANGIAYRRNAFEKVSFYATGWVKSFKLNGKLYINLYSKGGKGEFSRFVESEVYNKYRSQIGEEKAKALKDATLSKIVLNPHLAQLEDKIITQTRKISIDSNGIKKLCKILKQWTYNGGSFNTSYPFSEVLPQDNTPVTVLNDEECSYLTEDAQAILQIAEERKSRFTGDLVWDDQVIADIVDILTSVELDVKEALDGLGYLPIYTQEQQLWSSESGDTSYYFYTNEKLIQYRDYLVEFKKWYTTYKSRVQEEDDVHKLYWLVSYLDEEVLRSIDYQEKIRVLDRFLTEPIHERFFTSSLLREGLVIKLIRSVTLPNDKDGFLDALLDFPKRVFKHPITDEIISIFYYNNSNYKMTRFEALYDALDDDRLVRYVGVSFDSDNRKRYVTAIYNIWRGSKYDVYTYPTDGSAPALNLNCFFVNEGISYFIDDNNDNTGEPVLETGRISTKLVDSSNPGLKIVQNLDQDFHCGETINEKIITINKVLNYSHRAINQDGSIIGNAPSRDRSFEHKMFYHLFQPVTFMHHHYSDDNCTTQPVMPAFVFYYTEEYQRLVELDATISLGLELAIEAILFTASGGISAFRNIKHLRLVTKLGKGIQGTGNATKVWAGAEGALEIFSLSSGVASSIYNYLEATTQDGHPDKEKYAKQRTLFALLALTGGIAAGSARLKAKDLANDVLQQIDDFNTQGVQYDVDPDLLQIIERLGNFDELITRMRNKLIGLDSSLNGTNHLLAKFDDLSSIKKKKFYDDFFELNDSNFWNKLNNSNQAEGINNWKVLDDFGFLDRKMVDVITDQSLVDLYVEFHSLSDFKIKMNSFSAMNRVLYMKEMLKAWEIVQSHPVFRINLEYMEGVRNLVKYDLFQNIGNATKIEIGNIHRYSISSNYLNTKLNPHYETPLELNDVYLNDFAYESYLSAQDGLEALRGSTNRLEDGTTLNRGRQFPATHYELLFGANSTEIIPLKGVQSASRNEEVAIAFAGYSDKYVEVGSVRVIFKIKSKNGVYVDDFADWGSTLGPINHSNAPAALRIQEEAIMNEGYFKKIGSPTPFLENGVPKIDIVKKGKENIRVKWMVVELEELGLPLSRNIIRE